MSRRKKNPIKVVVVHSEGEVTQVDCPDGIIVEVIDYDCRSLFAETRKDSEGVDFQSERWGDI
jgi:hypothetical protein